MSSSLRDTLRTVAAGRVLAEAEMELDALEVVEKAAVRHLVVSDPHSARALRAALARLDAIREEGGSDDR